MKSNRPALWPNEIAVHEATHTIGRVGATVYPEDDRVEGYRLELIRADGTHVEFPYLELRLATEDERVTFQKIISFKNVERGRDASRRDRGQNHFRE